MFNWNEALIKSWNLTIWFDDEAEENAADVVNIDRQTTNEERRKSSTEWQKNQLARLRITADTIWCDCSVLDELIEFWMITTDESNVSCCYHVDECEKTELWSYQN